MIPAKKRGKLLTYLGRGDENEIKSRLHWYRINYPDTFTKSKARMKNPDTSPK